MQILLDNDMYFYKIYYLELLEKKDTERKYNNNKVIRMMQRKLKLLLIKMVILKLLENINDSIFYFKYYNFWLINFLF